VAYTKIGEIPRAKEDLKAALDVCADEDEKAAIRRAM
jgi:hypothetical protein